MQLLKEYIGWIKCYTLKTVTRSGYVKYMRCPTIYQGAGANGYHGAQ